jgi:hypothetical protein
MKKKPVQPPSKRQPDCPKFGVKPVQNMNISESLSAEALMAQRWNQKTPK